MRRLGILGGSFDPIHLGHIGLAERAAAEYQLDSVLMIPAKVSPFKTEARPLFDETLRWQMVVAACAEHPLLIPCDVELRRGGVSYAIDTVRTVKAEHPADELFFIIGEDSVAGLSRWREWEKLRTLCTFIAYPRTRESSTEIRRRLALGESVADLVAPAVAQILKNR